MLIGTTASRVLYVVLMLVPFGVLFYFLLFYPLSGFVFFALLAAAPAILIVTMARTAREYRPALLLTLLTALTYGLGLAAAIAF